MATLTVRNVEDDLKTEIRIEAAERGHSMEEETRQLLREALGHRKRRAARRFTNLADAIAARFDPLGGVELDIPPREPMREPPDFSGPEYER